MALSGEAFGNRMCYLEDISNEVDLEVLTVRKRRVWIVGLLSGFGLVCVRARTSSLSSSFARNGEYHFSRTGISLLEKMKGDVLVQSSASQGGQTFRTLLYGHAVLLRHYRSQMVGIY